MEGVGGRVGVEGRKEMSISSSQLSMASGEGGGVRPIGSTEGMGLMGGASVGGVAVTGSGEWKIEVQVKEAEKPVQSNNA